MVEEILKLCSSELSEHSNATTDSTFMFENGHIFSQEKSKLSSGVHICDSGYCCHATMTVIEKDWGKDFALVFLTWFT